MLNYCTKLTVDGCMYDPFWLTVILAFRMEQFMLTRKWGLAGCKTGGGRALTTTQRKTATATTD